MKNLKHSPRIKSILIFVQFFLIIFVYHILKDLKDTVVITASDAGAEVIPFIKIWGMLPLALLAGYSFAKLYHYYGREKTLYIFVTLLLTSYLLFAFLLYPFREELYLTTFAQQLKVVLPIGCKGFITMISYWTYTLFYLTAELWSMILLSILFWGYVNETTSLKQAKNFYPLCMFVGNCAGILSGQTSRYLCHTLIETLTWQQTLQIMISMVTICGITIMLINRLLSLQDKRREESANAAISSIPLKTSSKPFSFQECIATIFQSRQLMCIAFIVVGYALTSNLIEVVWKDSVKSVYPTPQAYNAYINQLTSLIGLLAVIMALLSRWIFKVFSWSTVALITPIALFITSSLFFSLFHLSDTYLEGLSTLFGIESLYLVMTLGSCYYVLGLTAKYTLFDMCKEMAFLSIEPQQRMKAKSVIDSIGSRLGKSGASCLTQAVLILFGSLTGNISLIGAVAVTMIGLSIIATKQLGSTMPNGTYYEKLEST